MNTIENIKATGVLSVLLVGEDGSIKETREFKNLVVSTGTAYIASRMKDTTATAMTHMELGTGTTAAANGDTTLGTLIASSRTALTATTVSSNTITYVATFNAGVGTGAVTEAGIFNASSAGTMLCRTVFPVVNKQSGDSMTVTWTVTIS
jgi:hypothetical protein